MQTRFYKGFSNLLDDYHLLTFDTLDSTNEEAKRLAKASGAHGAVVWARKQTQGKGRLGRSWVSQEGNLFVSLLLRPDQPVAAWSQLSFVAAVAVLETLTDIVDAPERLTCKWPNDVLLDGKKIAGILLESVMGSASSSGEGWVVLGVGVNVESFPGDADFPATCLTAAGVEIVSAKIVLSRFIHHFILAYNEWNNRGFTMIRKRWILSAWGMQKQMVARAGNRRIVGQMQGIDANGALLLRDRQGVQHAILAADVCVEA